MTPGEAEALLRRSRAVSADRFMRRMVRELWAREEAGRRVAARLAAGGDAPGGEDQAAAELLAMVAPERGTRREQVSWLLSRGYPADVAERAAARLIAGALAAVPHGATRTARPHEEICRVTGNAITGIG